METKQYAAAGPWISVEDALPENKAATYLVRNVQGELAVRSWAELMILHERSLDTSLVPEYWAEVIDLQSEEPERKKHGRQSR